MKLFLFFCFAILNFVISSDQTEGNNGTTNVNQEEAASKCESSGGKSYTDCSPYSTEENICCFVQGISNGTDEASCLMVDILFEGKIIEYNGMSSSGKLICTTSSNKGYYIKLIKQYISVLIIISLL